MSGWRGREGSVNAQCCRILIWLALVAAGNVLFKDKWALAIPFYLEFVICSFACFVIAIMLECSPLKLKPRTDAPKNRRSPPKRKPVFDRAICVVLRPAAVCGASHGRRG